MVQVSGVASSRTAMRKAGWSPGVRVETSLMVVVVLWNAIRFLLSHTAVAEYGCCLVSIRARPLGRARLPGTRPEHEEFYSSFGCSVKRRLRLSTRRSQP